LRHCLFWEVVSRLHTSGAVPSWSQWRCIRSSIR